MAVFPPELSFKCLPRNPKLVCYEYDKTFLLLGAQIHSWGNCNSIEPGMNSQCAFVYSWHAVCISAFLFLDGLLQNPLCVLGDITQARFILFSLGTSSYIITTYKQTLCLQKPKTKKQKTSSWINSMSKRFSKHVTEWQENKWVGEPAVLWHSDSAPFHVSVVQPPGESAPERCHCHPILKWGDSMSHLCCANRAQPSHSAVPWQAPKAVQDNRGRT